MENITCEMARALFDESIDGELDQKESKLLRAHLAHCETCRKEYEELENIHQSFRDLAVDVPDELNEKVMATIKKEPKPFFIRAKRLGPLVAVSAAALLCVAVLHSPVTDMFKANSKADAMEIKPDKDYSSNLTDMIDGILNNAGAEAEHPEAPTEDKTEGYINESQSDGDDVEIKQIYTIADTDLLLILLNQKQAMLCRKGNEEAVEMLHDFTYKETGNTIILEDDGQTQALHIEGKLVYSADDGELLAPFLK